MRQFINKHRTEFYELPRIQTQLLELGAATLASEHYRLEGYHVRSENAIGGRFRVKVSSRGHPWNYSWFVVERDDRRFEIHTNLAVLGHYGLDEGRYVVDVAVCRPGRVPLTKTDGRGWVCLRNQDLVTFVEAKKLVVYPMLLAQFVGIVHEVKPRFLSGLPPGFRRRGHFPPALVSTGHPASTSRDIVRGFTARGFRISVVPSFDTHLSSMRRGQIAYSPFDPAPF